MDATSTGCTSTTGMSSDCETPSGLATGTDGTGNGGTVECGETGDGSAGSTAGSELAATVDASGVALGAACGQTQPVSATMANTTQTDPLHGVMLVPAEGWP